MRGQTENLHYSLRVKKKEEKKKLRPTRRHFDIFGILSDTLLMCDSEEWMGGAVGRGQEEGAEGGKKCEGDAEDGQGNRGTI